MPKKLKSQSKQKDLETKNKRKKLVVNEGLSTNSQKVVFSLLNLIKNDLFLFSFIKYCNER